MNDNTHRGLIAAGLSTNVLFLALSLVDYARFESRFMWPIFVGWAVLIVLLVALALASSNLYRLQPDGAAPALARAVASLAQRPQPTTPGPTVIVKEGAGPALARAVATLAARGPRKPNVDLDAELVPAPEGPFKYNGYTLYSRSVQLKNGGERNIWFFAKRTPSSGTPAAKPAGFHVGVNARTGLPFLKRGTGADGEDLTPDAAPALRPQCSALTFDGKQCRNSARADSKYCSSHFGYQPPVISKAHVARTDTLARVRGARDTKPSTRKRSSA